MGGGGIIIAIVAGIFAFLFGRLASAMLKNKLGEHSRNHDANNDRATGADELESSFHDGGVTHV